jgi:hypothetical protein
MKKVLILTYYWPPCGGAGVQRWLKFVKYLPKYGITPVVYTHSNGELPTIDESLEKEIPEGVEVLKTEIWEPYDAYKKLTGKKGKKVNPGFLSEEKSKKSKVQDAALWVRGNFFIPDARKFWIKPSIKYLSKYIEDNDIDCIISSGPPHTMHMIGLALKKKFNIPWIADFRDPWTNIDFYDQLKLSKWADKKHHRLEAEVLKTADLTISVGPTLAKELSDLGAKRSELITNGFDPVDGDEEQISLDEKFSIAHIGAMNKSRNAEILWKALSELVKENDAFADKLEIKLVGKVDYFILKRLEEYGLDTYFRKVEYMPHTEVINEQKKSHILLLVVNDAPNAKGIITGKIFEYIAANRPILALAPKEGDLEYIVNYTKSGFPFSEESNLNDLKSFILDVFEERYQVKNQNVSEFTREKLTEQLVEKINSVI